MQQNDTALALIGLIFVATAFVGIALTKGGILSGPGSFGQAATVYWFFHLPFILPNAVANVSLSAFGTPTGSYLSMIGQTPEYVQAIVNLFFAPIIENIAFISVIGLLFVALKQEFGWNDFVAGSLSLGLGGAAFSVMHGAVDFVFFMFATTFMVLWAVFVKIDDFDWSIGDYSPVPLGLAAGWGMHKGNNLAASGTGVFESWTVFLSAPEPVLFVSYAIVGLEVVLMLAAAVFVAGSVSGLRN